MKLAMVQMKVGKDKEINVKNACQKVRECAKMGADMVVLPEMFVCAYDHDSFRENAEENGGYITAQMAKCAKESSVYLVTGSMPEKVGNKLYNTSFVYDRKGCEIACHRKVYLFDICVEGGQSFRESNTFSAGSRVTTFQTEFGRVGLMVCFDMRFPELARAMAKDGAQLLVVPAAFNQTTGPMHWDLLLRARAVDNGVWVAGVSPARNEMTSYVAYGHSALVSPWGREVCRMSSQDETALCDVDFDESTSMQQQIPVLTAMRDDIF